MLAFVHEMKPTENLSTFLKNAEEKENKVENTKYVVYSLPHLIKKFSYYFIYSSWCYLWNKRNKPRKETNWKYKFKTNNQLYEKCWQI